MKTDCRASSCAACVSAPAAPPATACDNVIKPISHCCCQCFCLATASAAAPQSCCQIAAACNYSCCPCASPFIWPTKTRIYTLTNDQETAQPTISHLCSCCSRSPAASAGFLIAFLRPSSSCPQAVTQCCCHTTSSDAAWSGPTHPASQQTRHLKHHPSPPLFVLLPLSPFCGCLGSILLFPFVCLLHICCDVLQEGLVLLLWVLLGRQLFAARLGICCLVLEEACSERAVIAVGSTESCLCWGEPASKTASHEQLHASRGV